MFPRDSDSRRSWREWIAALGPGAIVASLTIGTGELIFSSRAGALFGYRALGLFALVLGLKWVLVFSSARYWVFSDAHPLRRWAELPGPRGWLPFTLLLVAAPAFPVWVSFHSGTLGTLMGAVTGTRDALGGNATLVWGAVLLGLTWALSVTGGYGRQERFQTFVVALMLVSVVLALVLMGPDWGAMLAGLFHVGPMDYPDWARVLPEFRDRPVWVEVATYAGVIGGSGYDYLAYVAWLRDKHGSRSDRRISPKALSRFVAADATVSFLAVLVFSGVFVACGAILLGPRHQVPAGNDLLTLQAQFVSAVGAWLVPLYFAGAFLALAGTLYGTIEVAPAILRELLGAVLPEGTPLDDQRIRRWGVGWSALGAFAILQATLAWRMGTGTKEPINLVAWVTPANLFTGVLACGWISALNVWTDRRFAVAEERMGWTLALLNVGG
ncbi:MAG: Nramp family divalent metal transporter, partial [Verrucomicrobiales bacterium]|nr:Nramp family divalent metal transporter [Verrucomicrobiales bacterium]